MNLISGVQYQVVNDHKYHSGKIGRFEFLGGKDEDVICLSLPEKDSPKTIFCVGLYDICNFTPGVDKIIIR